MSITSIHQCRSLKAMIDYCITPKKGQESERVAALYSDLGNSNLFLQYGEETIKNHHRKVQGYTILQSFPKHEFDVHNQQHIVNVNELGRKLAYALYPNSPCLVITHSDGEGECLHNHILVLNHDLQTDGCIKSNRHYKYVKQENDKLMQRYGLEVCKPSEQKQTQGEYWTNKRNNWLEQLKASVDKAIAFATSMIEFQNNLLAEGVTPTLYKANGELKERFTYTLTDDNGKVHKKRSDKLGTSYTRQSIEQTLLSNEHQKQQQAIMPMSEWIELQKKKERNEELTKPKEEAKLIPQIDILDIHEMKRKNKTTLPADAEKEKKMKTELISKALKREKEYQELLRKRNSIDLQIKELNKKFEDDTYSDEDYATQDELFKESNKIKSAMKKMKADSIPQGRSKVELDESLIKERTLSKDDDYSL